MLPPATRRDATRSFKEITELKDTLESTIEEKKQLERELAAANAAAKKHKEEKEKQERELRSHQHDTEQLKAEVARAPPATPA
eukprot:3140754-Prymnesium_polylepis.1